MSTMPAAREATPGAESHTGATPSTSTTSGSRIQMKSALTGLDYDGGAEALAPRGGAAEARDAVQGYGGALRDQSGGAAPARGSIQMARSGRAIQRRVVQREETPTPENTGATPNTETTPENTVATPTFDGPRSYQAYDAHIRSVYGGQLAELAQMAVEFKAKGGEKLRVEQQLEGTLDEVSKLKREYAAKKAELDADKEAKRAMQGQIASAQASADHAGSTMPGLLAKAQDLVTEIRRLGPAAGEAKAQLESVMLAAMSLSGQIDPEGSGKGRALYVSIDETENVRLVVEARERGVPQPEQAELAVNYRNWLRTFFRSAVMEDQTHAEILYLRDEGKAGQKEGLSIAQVIEKVIGNMKKPDRDTGVILLRGDVTFETASPEELTLIYDAVIGSAATTNAGATAGAGATPTPETTTPNGNAETPSNDNNNGA